VSRPRGIKGLEGREPVGVVLSLGIKDARGVPVEKDRFHLVVPHEADGRRPHHAAFAPFNAAPPEKRQMIRGNLVHATEAECFDYRLRAQVSKTLGLRAHPNRRPVCEGDGVRAIRWTGDDPDDFTEIDCPNKDCPARLVEPAECKPFARLLFRLRWPDGNPLPSMVCKFTTGGWNTAANLKGFFDQVRRTAQQIGLTDYTLFGLPFTLTLHQQTRPAARTRFPVVAISPDMDLIEFFARQQERIAQLQAAPAVNLIEGPETDPAIEYEDVRQISGPTRIDQ